MFNHAFRRRAVVAPAILATVASSFSLLLTTSPAEANPAGTGLVISEVYGGGGNSGADYTNDFVELYNPTGAPISVNGWSVQYRAADTTGAPSGVTALTGSVPAGGRYLVQLAGGTDGSQLMPTPDATGTLNLSGTSGTVVLSNGTTAVNPGSGSRPANPAVVDLVGYGASNVWEGSGAAPAGSNTTSLARSATGADTDVNAADFTAGPATPVNSAGQGPRPPADRGTQTIAAVQGTAEQQGTGGASPLVGDVVTTEGVVTATYPTGGFAGFYLQTAGTGGVTDATPGASDAVFVYAPSAQASSLPAVGASVRVRGQVSEFNGLTQIGNALRPFGPVQITGIAALPPVTGLAAALPTTEAEREAHEGELYAPTDRLTVTNVFSTNQFAEIGLATGTTPLIQPTEVANPADGAAYDAAVADVARRAITLDDGASTNFLSSANQGTPLPWLSPSNPVRVGAAATLRDEVVLDYRNSTWKLQPQQQVTDTGASVATFANTRQQNLTPQNVGGDLRIGTFNVLNYFNTTGQVFESRGGSCTYFNDRDGDPVAVNSCSPNGPRGAAEGSDLNRQQAKIVRAINALGADVVSLEEIENSVKLIGETDRDDAVKQLVAALNTAANGSRRWAFVPSPPANALPPVAEQDVIRTAFIYNPVKVSPVGESKVLLGSTAFANARQPLAQAFKPIGLGDDAAFAVVVNHFKSKGNSTPPATGDNENGAQGAFNGDRRRQAAALATFANAFAVERGTEAVFLTGDFNAYTEEDPIRDLEATGYVPITSTQAGDYSYSFSGLSGSLDHVLGNQAARDLVTGADVWEINANESIAFQYSRFNYNVTRFFNAGDPFAASDHNPEVVGIRAPTSNSGTTEIQLLGANDYHGRLLRNGAEAGAAVLSGAVKQLRTENPNTVFMAAGDLIGASTFESFVAQDKPTIDVLNEAGLEVSAVGNHEFDAGYDDLTGRVIAAESADNPRGGARWKYLGANVEVKEGSDAPALAKTWTKEMNGVTVGFVGAVTEHLGELVSPDRIDEIEVTDIVEATNVAADALKSDAENPADVVVLLVHEGAPSVNCDTMDDDPTSDFGSIVTGVNANVDAIMSGHTHLAYNCSFTVPQWVTEGRAVTKRPVVSSGQYGSNLNRLKLQVNPATGDVSAVSQEILPLVGPDPDGSGSAVGTPLYPADPAVERIVKRAQDDAEVLGARKLGAIEGPFNRAKLADGTTENRGGESTLGNLVAEIQRWATSEPEAGSAQIAFMNPGGLRADLTGTGATSPRDVNYRQAATVQPFANTLVNMDLTGAEIEEVLEEQWQAAGSSRPFLRLGISKGFTYTYTPPATTAPAGTRGEVTGMWLDGEPVVDDQSYSVTVNSFLASGGDGFTTLGETRPKQDTGKSDLQAQVDYFAEFAAEAPLEVDLSQRSVGVVFPDGAPASYAPGSRVAFSVSSFSMTGPGDPVDTEVVVKLGEQTLGTAPVTSTKQAALPGYDEVGTASVDVQLPAGLAPGRYDLLLTGATTGTSVAVPVTVASTDPEPVTPFVRVAHSPSVVTAGSTAATVTAIVRRGSVPATGRVRFEVQGQGTSGRALVDGRASLRLARFGNPGLKRVVVTYLGNATTAPRSVEYFIRVTR